MKKLALLAVLLFAGSVAHAETIIDQLYGGFVGRAKLAVESTTDGTVQPEWLVNYVEIGRCRGGYIAAIDAGALGEVIPSSGNVESVQWTTGGKLHLSSLLKAYINLPQEWAFISLLEIDARASYNWTGRHVTYGLVAGIPFK